MQSVVRMPSTEVATKINIREKCFLGITAIFLVLIVQPFRVTMAQVISNDGNSPGSKLSVEGDGRVAVSPDVVEVSVGITTESRTPQEALRENSFKMQNVTQRVGLLGVEDRDVQTSQLSLNPIYKTIRAQNLETSTNEREISGFRASNVLKVKLRNLDQVGEALSVLVEEGVNQINNIQFKAENVSKEYNNARIKAIENAKSKADVFAAAAGYEVVGVREINAYDNFPAPAQNYGLTRAAFAMEDASVPISGGELVYSSRVSVVYEIQKVELS